MNSRMSSVKITSSIHLTGISEVKHAENNIEEIFKHILSGISLKKRKI